MRPQTFLQVAVGVCGFGYLIDEARGRHAERNLLQLGHVAFAQLGKPAEEILTRMNADKRDGGSKRLGPQGLEDAETIARLTGNLCLFADIVCRRVESYRWLSPWSRARVGAELEADARAALGLLAVEHMSRQLPDYVNGGVYTRINTRVYAILCQMKDRPLCHTGDYTEALFRSTP